MNTTDFINHKEVLDLLEDLRRYRDSDPSKFVFSDVIDAEGHQYVDLVQEGGGLLGIALIGYTYVLEQMGLRFVSLAGTSAGAINAILLAGLGKPDEMKSASIIELLANKNFNDFVDGDKDVQQLIRAFNKGAGGLKLAFHGLQVLDSLKEEMGLNPGKNFHQWLKDILDQQGVSTAADLKHRMNDFPEHIQYRELVKDRYRPIQASLAIIAADLTTNTKAVFPLMADIYYEEPENVHPADFVRASMSIPLFFRPFRLTHLPRSKKYLWKELAQYRGTIPEEVLLVDGGMLSNFAIDMFHQPDKVPTRPTFGVKLGLERHQPNEIQNYRQLLGGCFDAARQIRDLEFILNHPDYNNLVTVVDVGDHDWLNFDLPDDAKIDLFVRGARAAAEFLKKFHWEEYKDIRKKILVDKVIDIWRFADEKMRAMD